MNSLKVSIVVLLITSLPHLCAGQQNITTIVGTQANEALGSAVAPLGYVDNDQIPDFVVGSPSYNASSGQSAGRIQVVSGSSGSPIYEKDGDYAFAFFGSSIVAIPDVDGDHVSDFAVGAPGVYDGSSAAYVRVYSGATGVPIRTFSWSASGGRAGHSLAIGDVNGDGSKDLIVGIPLVNQGPNSIGRVEVYSVSSGQLLRSKNGPDAYGLYGIGLVVAGLGDLNNDGFEEYASSDFVGTPQILVVSGQDNAFLPRLCAWGGTYPNCSAASDVQSLSSVGDVNANGRPDFAVGFTSASPSVAVNVFSYSGGSYTKLYSVQPAGAWFGYSITPSQDINGDTVPDFLVGALGDQTRRGFVSYISGKTGKELSRIPGGFQEQFGFSVAAVGDSNGDGLSDSAVGANQYSTSTLSHAGRVSAFGTPTDLSSPGKQDDYFTIGKAVVVL